MNTDSRPPPHSPPYPAEKAGSGGAGGEEAGETNDNEKSPPANQNQSDGAKHTQGLSKSAATKQKASNTQAQVEVSGSPQTQFFTRGDKVGENQSPPSAYSPLPGFEPPNSGPSSRSGTYDNSKFSWETELQAAPGKQKEALSEIVHTIEQTQLQQAQIRSIEEQRCPVRYTRMAQGSRQMW